MNLRIASACCAALLSLPWSIHAVPVEFIPSDENFPNPERGLYVWGTMLDGAPDYRAIRGAGVTLAWARIMLDRFVDRPLDDAAIATIRRQFDDVRAAGVKTIVRVTYNENRDGRDASIAMMDTHLAQLAPVFRENEDLIAFFEAGLIGAWGEWHSSASKHDTPAGRAAVWNLIKKHYPPCVPVLIRRPDFVHELEGTGLPLDESTAFSCSTAARIGHHNDCWLSSETDTGTYQSVADRERWLGVLERDTRFVPWGGETCRPCDMSNCATALAEGRRLHATYLNRDYNTKAIELMQPCWDEIVRSLGHRFAMVRADVPESIVAGQPFSVSVTLANRGWAPVYRERPVLFRLVDANGTVIADVPCTAGDSDPRRWLPESGEITIAAELVLPAAHAGESISIALWLPDRSPRLRDRPEYAIRLANAGTWNAHRGDNRVAEGIPAKKAEQRGQ